MLLHVHIYRAYKKCRMLIYLFFSRRIVWLKFKLNNVTVGRGMRSFGIPYVDVWIGSKFTIGNNFIFLSGKRFNLLGRASTCYFIVQRNGVLTIGNNVGMTSASIVCYRGITIGDNVMLGANVAIYDSDFHSLKKEDRISVEDDMRNTKYAEIVIGNDVFIGAHSTILKGVTIGEGSIIGACSVVTRSVPKNEIWAGNPAKFIKATDSIAATQSI